MTLKCSLKSAETKCERGEKCVIFLLSRSLRRGGGGTNKKKGGLERSGWWEALEDLSVTQRLLGWRGEEASVPSDSHLSKVVATELCIPEDP